MSALSLQARRWILTCIALCFTVGGVIAAVQVLRIGPQESAQFPVVAWSSMKTSSPLEASVIAITGLLLLLRVRLARLIARVFLFFLSLINLFWAAIAGLGTDWRQPVFAVLSVLATSLALAFLSHPETKRLFERSAP
ncbi:hypothetical protein CfE428DRAFT_1524 [Chthoniobacter flavus Ellin428]|uniref:Uncharacterized protein n=1 Tax=Chthoniobacter flavus Ellin428 TaxID=497964 RepID=B4CY83_9BACT|nr:hypothetical protein [Chthoniobacter flavus]EDY21231.1 hypothetical protein CfE428DRAFT_1524 [Chthoniobacter flavus Ellin428]TCO87599.1 hypothetical protein EV701_121101 [Chthoniobacter flavus]